MNFDIYLDFPDNVSDYDASVSINQKNNITEIDNIYGLTELICKALENYGNIKFCISGFKDLARLDVSCDLMCAVEYLPSVLRSINDSEYNFIIGLYEQGTEKDLLFWDVSGDMVRINLMCLSHEKDYGTIFETKENIRKSFLKLYDDFIFLTEKICGKSIKDNLLKVFATL